MNTIIPEYFAKINKTRVFTPPDLLKYVNKVPVAILSDQAMQAWPKWSCLHRLIAQKGGRSDVQTS